MEARAEGLIELKLVRKPPMVSRGYGSVAILAQAIWADDVLVLKPHRQEGGLARRWSVP